MQTSKLGQPVSLLRRLGAMIYDFFLLATVLIIASFLVVIPFDIKPEDSFFLLYQVYIFVVAYVFYAWFWTHNGQTLGMRTWKMQLVNLDSSEITWGTALIRYCVAIFSWAVFGIGFLWSIWDKQKRTWHDIASKTKLVRT
jgi:uncharacterized RDD family membrane protein YckC